ncbi:hypothetical protein [Candidatus Kinetoplastidibacterium crithidiae]|uniref:Uncharacterized protein n=1 Tax=Candidatus Kinetoplastidibacterium crithidiae TCC036E TaxID=1208918 RepID=M1L5E7_9PROT|nr:hypothetical protein [Candidatus Kinetoplastibacterium crithidii]AFZ82860.1 hypothetical protein CKCE_0436 [Candidatus Kinetoplastibacterium crithidii (ex Angomonas deanei ATCC 30255)]AGF47863.1 hypothetical protein CDEE_0003 [Candidatus Kinetoplastibacterium crithidii TCC036E]
MLENIEKLSLLVDKLIEHSIKLSSENLALQSSNKYAEDEMAYLKKTFVDQESELSSLRDKSKKLEDLVFVLQIDIKKVEEDLRAQLMQKEIAWNEKESSWNEKEKTNLACKARLEEQILSLEQKNTHLRESILSGVDRLKRLKTILPSFDLKDGDINGAA